MNNNKIHRTLTSILLSLIVLGTFAAFGAAAVGSKPVTSKSGSEAPSRWSIRWTAQQPPAFTGLIGRTGKVTDNDFCRDHGCKVISRQTISDDAQLPVLRTRLSIDKPGIQLETTQFRGALIRARLLGGRAVLASEPSLVAEFNKRFADLETDDSSLNRCFYGMTPRSWEPNTSVGSVYARSEKPQRQVVCSYQGEVGIIATNTDRSLLRALIADYPVH